MKSGITNALLFVLIMLSFQNVYALTCEGLNFSFSNWNLFQLAEQLKQNPSSAIKTGQPIYMRMLREPKNNTDLAKNLSDPYTRRFNRLTPSDEPERRIVFLSSIDSFHRIFGGSAHFLQRVGFPLDEISYYLENYDFNVVFFVPNSQTKILEATWENLEAVIFQAYAAQPKSRDLLINLLHRHFNALKNDLSWAFTCRRSKNYFYRTDQISKRPIREVFSYTACGGPY